MKITNLKLTNYRNYNKIDFAFCNGLNIIIGNNAQGKTNILEAIYFLSITKSFLSVNEKNCIKDGTLYFKIEGNIKSLNNNCELRVTLNSNGKKLELNDNEIKKHYHYVGILKTIIFFPDDVRLIKDSPSNRRRFLNIEMSQLYSNYIDILNEFILILRQRNEYLKMVKKGYSNDIYFDILNNKYLDLCVNIYKYRFIFVENINKYICDIFEKISGYSELLIDYSPNFEIKKGDDIRNSLLLKLNDNYDREVSYGTTLYGPHRDDFIFLLSGNNLLLYGSQGQIKMAVLALKLSLVDVFKDVSGEYPVLLLDDLFGELDVSKRNRVLAHLNSDIQTIVTTTDLNNIDDNLINNAKIFRIDNGNVSNNDI